MLREQFLDRVGDEQRLVFGVRSFVQADLLARAGVGPQPLALALFVVRDDRAGGFENVLRRAVILLQPDHFRVRIIALEIENIANIGAAPAVNRLIFVADHAPHSSARSVKQPHQFVLAAVGVLILVDHQELDTARLYALRDLVVVPQQADRFEQQIVEIERVRLDAAGSRIFRR